MSLITIQHLHISVDTPEILRLLNRINERINTMPTVAELKVAIAETVGQEAAEVAARLKALEDKIAELTAGQIVSEADRDEMLAMVRGIFTPAP